MGFRDSQEDSDTSQANVYEQGENMTGLFRVHYFDPMLGARNQDSVDVLAAHVADAIKKADRKKALKRYRVEYVECLGFADD